MTLQPEQSKLKQEVSRVVKIMATFGLSVCALVAVMYGFTRGNWLNGLLVGITMAMSLLPEEFPVVLTIFLALGAWRISRKNVLTRAPTAIEALGSATVLCVDKTGTLTQNRMAVHRLFASGESYAVDDAKRRISRISSTNWLNSASWPASASLSILWISPLSNWESAILSTTEHLHRDWNCSANIRCRQGCLAVSRVWQAPAAALTLSPQRERLRQSRSFASCRLRKWNSSEAMRKLWQTRAYAFWRLLAPNFEVMNCQMIPTPSSFVFWVWLGWRIPSGQKFRRRSKSVVLLVYES